MSSLRASPEGLEIVDRARKQRGWTKAAVAWYSKIPTTEATMWRFWRRVPIREDTFKGICRAIRLDWEKVAEQGVIKLRYQDWGEAPDIPVFYGRKTELAELEQKILRDCCRGVTLLGIGGIGKTALSVKLAEKLQDEFQYIIWRSISHAPPLARLLADLIEFISDEQETELPDNAHEQISKLIDYLSSLRCLVVLDGWETFFKGGKLVGEYRQSFKDYGELLRRIGKARLFGKSCLIVISQEKPQEIATLESEKQAVCSYQLEGLGETAKEILREKGLAGEHEWGELIKCYRGNPLALRIVCTTIQDYFGRSVSEFLNKSLYLGDFEGLLNEQFQRLCPLEAEIMCCLATANEPTSSFRLHQKLGLEVSITDLLNALESLSRRCLIEKIPEGNEILLSLQPMVRKGVARSRL